MTDVRPVNFEIFTEEKAALIWEVGKAMLTYLFTPGRVKVKRRALGWLENYSITSHSTLSSHPHTINNVQKT
jgi:hypothetical protein